MSSRSFREEALRFALDGDSVQNLVRVAASDWGMDRQQTLDLVTELAAQGLLGAYEHDPQTGRNKFLDATKLNLSHLDSVPYTFLLKTDRTIPALEQSGAEEERRNAG
jgi:hypothetical protein